MPDKTYQRVMKKHFRRKAKFTKWRQQKLAVGTVAKIATKVAKRLDEKNLKYIYSNVFSARDGYNWDSVTTICPSSKYRPIQSGALESTLISDLSGLIQDSSQVIAGTQTDITVGVKAIQCRISIRNPNIDSIRYEAQIIFIPNLYRATNDAVDFLRPDVFMLYKKGGGGLLYDGIAKKAIRNMSSSQSSVRDYTIIARKFGTIRGTSNSGISKINIDQTLGDYASDIPYVSRRNFTMTKYFKRERRHNCKAYTTPAQPFTDGNYFLIIFSDLALGGPNATTPQYIEYCSANSIKLRIVGPTQPLTT